MKVLKVILLILAVLIALMVGTYAYYGGFKKVDVRIETQGGEVIVYEDVIGSYMQVPEVCDRVYNVLLNNEKIETTKGIGIFYDDPENVAEEKLRSKVGCIIDNADSATIANLSEKYLVEIIPQQEYIVAEFPKKGFMSIMVGIMKVYPALDDYCEKHGYGDSPITEIYDEVNKKTVYRQEIAR